MFRNTCLGSSPMPKSGSGLMLDCLLACAFKRSLIRAFARAALSTTNLRLCFSLGL